MVTLMILDEDGDLHKDTATYAEFDSEDDIALVRELTALTTMTKAERQAYLNAGTAARKRVEQLGIVHPDENAVIMSTKKYESLIRGALCQLDEFTHQGYTELQEEVARLRAEIDALKGDLP